MTPKIEWIADCHPPSYEDTVISNPSVQSAGRRLQEVSVSGTLSDSLDQGAPHTSQWKTLWNRKWRLLKDQGRAVKQIPVSSIPVSSAESPDSGNACIYVYFSKNREAHLNGRIKRSADEGQTPVVCRHLAMAHAMGDIGRYKKTGGNKYAAIMKTPCEGIVTDEDLNKQYDRKSHREAHYFKLKNLTLALQSVAHEVWVGYEGGRKSYLLSSGKHDMAIHVEKSGQALKILFYDPNDTLRHKVFIAARPEHLVALSLDDMLPKGVQINYYGDAAEEAVACLLDVNTDENRNRCRVHLHGEIDNYYLPLVNGHYGHQSLPAGFRALSDEGVPGLSAALIFGHAAAIRDYLNHHFHTRPGSGHSVAELLEQTYPSDADQTCDLTGLALAIHYGQCDAVQAYTQGVLDSPLDVDAQCQLLQLGPDNTKHCKALAWLREESSHNPTLDLYRNTLLSHLSHGMKLWLTVDDK